MRFKDWKYPEVEEGKLTKYNWIVQHKDKLKLGYKTDIGAFTCINAKNSDAEHSSRSGYAKGTQKYWILLQGGLKIYMGKGKS